MRSLVSNASSHHTRVVITFLFQNTVNTFQYVSRHRSALFASGRGAAAPSSYARHHSRERRPCTSMCRAIIRRASLTTEGREIRRSRSTGINRRKPTGAGSSNRGYASQSTDTGAISTNMSIFISRFFSLSPSLRSFISRRNTGATSKDMSAPLVSPLLCNTSASSPAAPKKEHRGCVFGGFAATAKSCRQLHTYIRYIVTGDKSR